MAKNILVAVPMAFVWMLLTSHLNGQGFLVGYFLSLGMVHLFQPGRGRVNWHRLPGQLQALLVYVILQYRDILLSGLDTARKILSLELNLKPGVVAIPVQDPENNPLITALSADAISLTPGELVMEIKDNTMYVHTLDVERTAVQAATEQARRLQLLKRILGKD